MPKIGCCLIVKNEEKTIEECLESIAGHVDELVIVDTGSTDKTVEICNKFTDKVLHFDWIDDFSAARQFALEALSDDCDWFVWLDADDVVKNAEAWRGMAERDDGKVDGYVFPYDYSRDEKTGQNTCTLYRERLIKNPKAWFWYGAVHEVLMKKDKTQPAYAITDECSYFHKRPEEKNTPERNLKIIQKYLADCKKKGEIPDPRMVIYEGSELMAHGQHLEAIRAFKDYIKVSGWDEEKYQAFHKMSDCLRAVGKFDDAIQCEMQGLTVKDDWADGYFGIAECYYHKKEWDKVLRWTERGFALGSPKTLLIVNPLDYTYAPRLYYAIALFNLGRVHEAIKITEEALDILPHDTNLQHNLMSFREAIRLNDMVEAALKLSEELVNHDEPLKALELLKNVPYPIEFDGRIRSAFDNIFFSVEHAFDSDFYKFYYDKNEFHPLAIEETENFFGLPRSAELIKELGETEQTLKVLDIGCNDGAITCAVAKAGHHILGIDLNPRGVEFSERRAKELGLERLAKFQEGSVESLPEDTKYDVIYAFEVIEHVKDVDEFLEECEKRLAPNGRIILSTPDGVFHRDSHGNISDTPELNYVRQHLRCLPRYALTELIEKRDGVVIKNIHHPDRLGYVSYRVATEDELSKRHITLYCPFTYEDWSPDSLETGIGGSEEAVIHIARQFRELGHRVTVYGAMEGCWDEVLYHRHMNFNPRNEKDVLIVWRSPWALDARPQAKNLYLWLHDVPMEGEYTPFRISQVDKIFVLSEWHRQCLPQIPDEMFIMSRNGVDILEAEKEIQKRDLTKVVYGSSPDRGLDKLLEVWGGVVKEVPEAKLHIFYGWDMYTKLRGETPFKHHVQNLIEKNKDSIVEHGRVGAQELWNNFSNAGIWAYPTYFDEISCITAMRAQMTGAWPVAVPRAALSETIKWGTKVEHDVSIPEGLEAYKQALIDELKASKSGELDDYREKMMAETCDFYSWQTVAEEWAEVFESASVNTKTAVGIA